MKPIEFYTIKCNGRPIKVIDKYIYLETQNFQAVLQCCNTSIGIHSAQLRCWYL